MNIKLKYFVALIFPLFIYASEMPTGMWMARDLSVLIGFTEDGKAILSTDISSGYKEYSYEVLSDYQFQLKVEDASYPIVGKLVTADMSIRLVLDGREYSLSKAPNIAAEDIAGEWFSHDTYGDGDAELTAIITRRETDYDFEFVSLNHEDKTYKTSSEHDYGVPFEIHDGFRIYEGGQLAFVITFVSKERLEYVDLYGTAYTEIRYSGQGHLEIPEGYTRREY